MTAETPTYNLPYETTDDAPGDTLRAPAPILAESVEAELERVDSDLSDLDGRVEDLEDVVNPGVGWNIITPTMENDGVATYSTITGRWRRIGVLTVHVIIYLVCNGSGSGSSAIAILITGAPPINRATRQMLPFNAEGMSGGGGGNRMGHLLSLTSGSGTRWDRVRFQDGVDSHLDNVTGADVVSGMILVAQGTYQEEET